MRYNLGMQAEIKAEKPAEAEKTPEAQAEVKEEAKAEKPAVPVEESEENT